MLIWGEPGLHNVKKEREMNTARRIGGKKAKPNYLDVSDACAFSLAISRAKTKDQLPTRN